MAAPADRGRFPSLNPCHRTSTGQLASPLTMSCRRVGFPPFAFECAIRILLPALDRVDGPIMPNAIVRRIDEPLSSLFRLQPRKACNDVVRPLPLPFLDSQRLLAGLRN